MSRDPYRYYRVEARELLDGLGQAALDLEKGADGPEVVARLLRLAHTLKGASRVVKRSEVAALAHEIEEALAPHRDAGAPPPARVREVRRRLGEMSALLADLDRAGAPPAASVAAAAGGSEPAAAVLRADMDDADAVLRTLSEQGAHHAVLRAELSALERARRLAAVLADQLGPRGRGSGAQAAAKALSLAEDLRGLLARLQRGLSTAAEQVERDHAEVRDAAERLRLAATGALFTPIEGAARDAAFALGKRIEFAATGGENRLDVAVLSPLRQALLHVVRNAVAHGIEPPAERAAAGKAEAGRVELRIERRAQRLALVCSDDGRGVDLEAVRRAAVERGVIGADHAARLDADQVLKLLLRGGVSTSAAVSQVSGRGIGLDVVREIVDGLQGELSVTSRSGAGTTVELCVPVTLWSMAVLFVEAAGTPFGVPLDAVSRTLRVTASDTIRSEGCESVLDGAEAVPFMRLAAALRQERTQPDPGRASSAVLVRHEAGRVALGVDRLLGVESVLVRPLPALAPPSPLASGVSLDAAGAPRLVLDPAGLAAAVRVGARARSEISSPARRPVLVVDDSLTTRMLEQSILESAGYEVDVAVSAEEALARARRQTYGLFVVDVEMPGMDGFEFVERTRADPALRATPAILVTSRSSAADRRRGEEVGARAFIVKSEFDQAQLLRTIRELMG